MIPWRISAIAFTLVTVACGDQTSTPATSTPTGSAARTPATTTATAAQTAAATTTAVADEDGKDKGLFPEDHEEDAETQIDASTYKDELAKLEKEIDADK